GPMLEHPRMLMGAVMMLLLIIGNVMDLTPTILVMGPVLMPLITAAGIDPTYFGVMFILVGTLGLIHPPVCTVLNVVCGVARISLESATLRISTNVTGDFGNVTDFDRLLGCAGKIVGMGRFE